MVNSSFVPGRIGVQIHSSNAPQADLHIDGMNKDITPLLHLYDITIMFLRRDMPVLVPGDKPRSGPPRRHPKRLLLHSAFDRLPDQEEADSRQLTKNFQGASISSVGAIRNSSSWYCPLDRNLHCDSRFRRIAGHLPRRSNAFHPASFRACRVFGIAVGDHLRLHF